MMMKMMMMIIIIIIIIIIIMIIIIIVIIIIIIIIIIKVDLTISCFCGYRCYSMGYLVKSSLPKCDDLLGHLRGFLSRMKN